MSVQTECFAGASSVFTCEGTQFTLVPDLVCLWRGCSWGVFACLDCFSPSAFIFRPSKLPALCFVYFIASISPCS